ncbi:MAG: hypothetical protein WDO68_07450 [Gammaproteobacteria bacterium]
MNASLMKDSMVSAFDPTSQTSASSLTRRLALSSDAAAVLAAGGNVRRCLDELLELGLPADALAVVARTLPKRYVVAWACECFKGALASLPAATNVDRAGLSLAQQWLVDPTEEKRRAALDFAEAGEFGTPGAWIAASAGWSDGSLLPRGYDPIPPPDHLPAEAAVAALRLAASQSSDYAGTISGFITRALQIFGPPLQEARQ